MPEHYRHVKTILCDRPELYQQGHHPEFPSVVFVEVTTDTQTGDIEVGQPHTNPLVEKDGLFVHRPTPCEFAGELFPVCSYWLDPPAYGEYHTGHPMKSLTLPHLG